MADVTPCGLLHPTLSQPCHLPAGHRQRGAPECVCLLPGQLPLFVGWQVQSAVRSLDKSQRGELRWLESRYGGAAVARAAGLSPRGLQDVLEGKRVSLAILQRLLDCLRLPAAAFQGGCA